MSLTIERLPGPESLEDIAGEWDLLDCQISPRTPFTSPHWIIPWWKHFARRRGRLFRDEFFCHVVRGDGGRLVAVVPLMRTSVPGIGPPILRKVQFFGVDAALTEIRGVICRPEDHAAVVEALVQYFVARRGEWDVFRWAGLRQPLEFFNARRPLTQFRARDELSDFVVDLPRTWDELRRQVSSNMRKNLRRPYELLERDGHLVELRVTERPDGVAAAIARFLALHGARASADDMITHPHKFLQPHVRAFFSGYLHNAAKRGELRLFELEIGGVVVASRVAFLIGSDLYLYFSGYNPEWKTYSVMTVLMAEMFKWALAQGLERVNLSTGYDQSKMRWKPREVAFRYAVQVSPSWRAWSTFSLFKAYEAVGDARLKAYHSKWGRRRHVQAQPEAGVSSTQESNWSFPSL